MATLKSFMRKNPNFRVFEKYSFDGMIDGNSSAQAGIKGWDFDKTIRQNHPLLPDRKRKQKRGNGGKENQR